MLTHILRQSGFAAEAIPIGTVEEMLGTIEERRAEILFVSALPPFAIRQARALCRRARQRFPDLKIMVGLWESTAKSEKVQQRLGADCFDKMANSLREAELQVRLLEGLN
jgi:hypothetical protein